MIRAIMIIALPAICLQQFGRYCTSSIFLAFMHSRLFVMAVALIISALATVSTSFAVAEFHSDVMLFYAEYIVLFSLQIVLADYHKPSIFFHTYNKIQIDQSRNVADADC